MPLPAPGAFTRAETGMPHLARPMDPHIDAWLSARRSAIRAGVIGYHVTLEAVHAVVTASTVRASPVRVHWTEDAIRGVPLS